MSVICLGFFDGCCLITGKNRRSKTAIVSNLAAVAGFMAAQRALTSDMSKQDERNSWVKFSRLHVLNLALIANFLREFYHGSRIVYQMLD